MAIAQLTRITKSFTTALRWTRSETDRKKKDIRAEKLSDFQELEHYNLGGRI